MWIQTPNKKKEVQTVWPALVASPNYFRIRSGIQGDIPDPPVLFSPWSGTDVAVPPSLSAGVVSSWLGSTFRQFTRIRTSNYLIPSGWDMGSCVRSNNATPEFPASSSWSDVDVARSSLLGEPPVSASCKANHQIRPIRSDSKSPHINSIFFFLTYL